MDLFPIDDMPNPTRYAGGIRPLGRLRPPRLDLNNGVQNFGTYKI